MKILAIVYMIFSFQPEIAMDRRHFLEATGTALGVAAIPRAARPSSRGSGGRMVLSLNRNRRYTPERPAARLGERQASIEVTAAAPEAV